MVTHMRVLPLSVAVSLALGCTGGAHPDTSDRVSGADSADTSVDSAALGPAVPARFLPEGQANLLLTSRVSVDPVHRRALATSLISGAVGVIDLDAATLLGCFDVGGSPSLPEAVMDGRGQVWVSGQRTVPRLDPVSGAVQPFDFGLVGTDGAFALPGEGGVVLLGTDADAHSVVLRVDPDGVEQARVTLGGRGSSIGPADGGTAVVASEVLDTGGTQVEVFDVTALTLLRTCEASAAGNTVEQQPDGRFVLPNESAVGEARCDGTAPGSVSIGVENKQAFTVGDDLLVLDRIGDTTGRGPNWGIARWFTSDLVPTGVSFSTGKNSGHGGLDSSTGLIWMNSEGTSEAQAYDPHTGTLAARVRLGAHLESIAVSPEAPGIAWLTGRLSGTVARIDTTTGAVLATHPFDGWPIAPVLTGGALYALDGLTQELWAFDPDTLDVRAHLDLGLADNVGLVFDDLVAAPDRGTLLLADAADNAVLELDPASGATLHRWALPGSAPSNPDIIGVLRLAVVDDAVIVLATVGGVLTRIELDSGADPVSVMLPTETTRALGYAALPSPLWTDGAALYVGGHRYDPGTLTELPEGRLDVAQVLGARADGLVGWDAASAAVITFDESGARTGSTPIEASALLPAVPVWAGADRILYARNDEATVYGVDLGVP